MKVAKSEDSKIFAQKCEEFSTNLLNGSARNESAAPQFTFFESKFAENVKHFSTFGSSTVSSFGQSVRRNVVDQKDWIKSWSNGL